VVIGQAVNTLTHSFSPITGELHPEADARRSARAVLRAAFGVQVRARADDPADEVVVSVLQPPALAFVSLSAA
jgi:hypothetical protein